jgi:hypothetical protein
VMRPFSLCCPQFLPNIWHYRCLSLFQSMFSRNCLLSSSNPSFEMVLLF